MKKIVCIIIFSFCFIYNIKAQRNIDSAKFSINIVPQYVFISGIRTDVEYALNNDVHIFGGMQYYLGNVNSNASQTVDYTYSISSATDKSKRSNDELSGYGFNAGLKYYFYKNKFNENYYIGADVTYNNFDFKLNEYDYFPYYDNGLRLYEYKLGKLNANSNQMGYHVTFGFSNVQKRFVYNLWLGAGYTDTNTSQDFHKYRKFDNYLGYYAYKGWAPYLGAKIGFILF